MRVGTAIAMSMCAVAALAPALAWAHDGQPIAPHDLPGAWSFEPAVVAMLTLTALLYWRGSSAMRRRAQRTGQRPFASTACFVAGFVVLVLALVSPLHALGAALFSAHMAQHELLMVIAAPLLVLGSPLVPMLFALPMHWRRVAGRAAASGWVAGPWRVLTAAPIAFLIHAIAIWVWHLPGPYQSSLSSEAAHSAQHASFLLSALLFWWAIIHGRRGRVGHGAAVLYVFGTAVHTSVLGALLVFTDFPWYPAYGATTMQWGFTALEDQHLAGLIMWIPAGVAYGVTALWLLASWMRESERRTARREMRSDGIATARTARARAVAIVLVASMVSLSACDRARVDDEARILTGGDPKVGKGLAHAYGCGTCHMIPGFRGARPVIGPPLEGVGARAYIAGVLTNTPDNMQRWLMNPKAVDPLTAMPNVGLNAAQARHVAAYLYTLR